MFRRLPDADAAMIDVTIDGRSARVRAGDTVAAALLSAGVLASRAADVSGAPRAPYCMMGVCFDCLVTIENLPMHLTLVVVPNLASRLWEDGSNREQEAHPLRLEDTALGVYQGNAFAPKLEAGFEISSGQIAPHFSEPLDCVEGCKSKRLIVLGVDSHSVLNYRRSSLSRIQSPGARS